MILLIGFAFLAGVITILSPCILPILPIIFSSTIGGENTGKGRPFGVVTGFVLSFTFFTLFLSTIVRLTGISADALRIMSVVVIAGFGASLLIPGFQSMMEKLFARLSQFVPRNNTKQGWTGGLLIGLSLGLLWTPCVGPILASVISLALTGSVNSAALFITLSYALGTAIPMLLIMWGGQKALQKVPWLVSNTGKIQKFFGVLMIITALGIYLNWDRKFQTWVLETFPQYGTGLTQFEDNEQVKEQLDEISGEQSLLKPEVGKPMFDSENSLLKPQEIVAPELIVGGQWFNSQPLNLEELKGKVVLVDFWTYSCINCQRTFPYLRTWWEKYQDKGLVIIGVHSPEFEFEKDADTLADAINDFDLKYPIMQDNNFATWRAYSNRYWPAKYLIDKEGYIRYWHFGEGKYDQTEQAIQELLKDTGVADLPTDIDNPDYQLSSRSPETYLGYKRIENFASLESIQQDQLANYTAPDTLDVDQVAYQGQWIITEEYAQPKAGAKLLLNFEGQEVFLVMNNREQPAQVRVIVDGQAQYPGVDVIDGMVTIDKDTLYNLVKLDQPGQHILELEFLDDNAEVYAFTFG